MLRLSSLAVLALVTACSGSAPPTDASGPAPATAAPAAPEAPAQPPEPAANGDKPDLTTEAGARAAYEKLAGKPLHEDDCVGVTEISDVVVFGGFGHDRGCRLESAIVDGKLVTAAQLRSEGLASVGWQDLAPADRPAFALNWVKRVLYRWGGSFVEETEASFDFKDTPAFAAPAAKADGEAVVVTAWVHKPAGMIHQRSFKQIEVRIDAAGAVTESNTNNFVVDGARLP